LVGEIPSGNWRPISLLNHLMALQHVGEIPSGNWRLSHLLFYFLTHAKLEKYPVGIGDCIPYPLLISPKLPCWRNTQWELATLDDAPKCGRWDSSWRNTQWELATETLFSFFYKS